MYIKTIIVTYKIISILLHFIAITIKLEKRFINNLVILYPDGAKFLIITEL